MAKLLTCREIAAQLGVSGSTVRRWIQEGALRALVHKGWIRITPDDLQEFLRRSSTLPPTRHD